MKKFSFFLILIVTSCRVNNFAVNENNKIYPCAPVGTVIIDSSMRVGDIVKITVIGKKGRYSYEIINAEGKVIKSGKYEKTHIIRTKGEKENTDGSPPTKYRSRYYEPDTVKSH